MKNVLDIDTAPGTVVHFSEGSDNAITDENQFAVKLLHPESVNGSIVYRSVEHIFTAKELNRAAVRYYSDCNLIDDEPLIPTTTQQHNHQIVGYVGIRNYVNRNGILTTRFITQLDTSSVAVLGIDKCVMLFTAREMQRSADRVRWLDEQLNPSFLTRVKRFFHE